MIAYNKWKTKIDATVPKECKIGSDIFLAKGINSALITGGPFRLDIMIVLILNSGSCKLKIDMQEHEAKAPCMILFFPNRIFQIEEATADLQSTALIYSNDFLNNLFTGGGNFSELRMSIFSHPVFALGETFMAFGIYINLLEALMRSPIEAFKKETAKHLTLSMFYGLSGAIHQAKAPNPITREASILRLFEKEVKTHYKRERTVEFYASKLCISPKYLSAVITRQTGKSALCCINEFVLTESKALLLSTDLSVQEIALRLGFPSQSVFGKFFKRLSGVSPLNFRKKV